MTQQEGIKKIVDDLNVDFKHKYYAENCELYYKYLTLSTGKGWETFLHRLTSRVSMEEFQEIINVTIDLCKSVTKNLTHVFYRVTRSIGIRVDYAAVKQEEYADLLTTFGRWGFEGYMDKRFTDFCKIDPNGWLVVDFKETDGSTYARPYPVEFYSPDIIDYDYDLNKLLFLLVKQDRAIDGDRLIADYTIYTEEGAAKLICRSDLDTGPVYDPNKIYVTGDLIALKERKEVNPDTGKEETVFDVYEVLLPEPYNLEYVPAICTGYLPDESHRGETFLNFFDNAVPLLEKIIKANSESDISMAKHAFPQKVQYIPPCPAKCEKNEAGCYCGDDGKPCPTCNGEGHLGTHRTGLDYIYVPFTPDNIQAGVDVNNMITYVGIPLDTIKYQWEHIIDDLVGFAKRVMYNTEIFTQQQVQDTATSKLIEMENMYDTLYLYAVHFASVKKWIHETVAAITDINIEVNATVSKDFKLLGKAQLLEMLQLANTAGANAQVIEAINDELVYSFYGSSDKYDKYLQRKVLLPFQNKSKEQIMLILNALPDKHPLKMMYQFGEDIINMLELQHENWTQYTLEKKQQLIQEEMDKIAAQVEESKPPAPSFGAAVEEEQEEQVV